jgi:hypothetical protein
MSAISEVSEALIKDLEERVAKIEASPRHIVLARAVATTINVNGGDAKDWKIIKELVDAAVEVAAEYKDELEAVLLAETPIKGKAH